jgi:hypothetical protein
VDFRATDEFINVYESLDDGTAAIVDEAILRLMDDHKGAWARHGRVTGESGEAWILEIRTGNCDASLYWDYLDDTLILLVILIVRPG